METQLAELRLEDGEPMPHEETEIVKQPVIETLDANLRVSPSQVVEAPMAKDAVTEICPDDGEWPADQPALAVSPVRRVPSQVHCSTDPEFPREKEALQALRTMLKKEDAVWTSDKQREAVRVCLEGSTDVLVLLGTGSGKTMVALIPMVLEPNSATVIVLPLKSLLTDYKRKLDALGVEYEVYGNSKVLSGMKRLLLVSADMAKQEHWTTALTSYHHNYFPVKRLVFDEGHYVLTSSDFRDSIRNPYELRALPMQFIVMSGSVPPQAEAALTSAFGLVSTTVTVRRLMLQPRVKDADDVIRQVSSVWRAESKTMADEDRALVFVPYVTEGNKLAKLLGCDIYKSDLSDRIKENIYYRWLKGDYKVMVCTSAFSAGNDYPSVRLVFHAGSPLEMIGFIQEVSRGGRDKKPTKCIIIPCNRKSPNPDQDSLQHKGRQAVWNMLFSSSECLRYCITLFNDGHGVRCTDDEENQICSRCESNRKGCPQAGFDGPPGPGLPAIGKQKPVAAIFESAHQTAKMRKVEMTEEEQTYVSDFKKALVCYCDTCAICLFNGYSHPDPLDALSCPLFSLQESSVARYRYFKSKLHYSSDIHKSVICFKCHIPTCHDLLHMPLYYKQDCPNPHTVTGVCWVVFFGTSSRPLMESHFNHSFPTLDAYIAWLNGPVIPGHKSNLTAVFLWYTSLAFK